MTEDIFWQEEILFLKWELGNKPKTVEPIKSRNNFYFIKSLQKKISKNAMTNNSVINIDNYSFIANSHQSKFTKDQFTSTANTSEALIITKDISEENKMKHVVNNTANNNQNLDNDVERVRKNAIKVENQLKEIRKSLNKRYLNGQRKPNNQNQSECKVEDKTKWRKNTTLIVEGLIISGMGQQRLSINGIVKLRHFPGGATIKHMYDYIKRLLKKAHYNVILRCTNDTPNTVKGTNNGKATLTVNKVNEHLFALQLEIVDNSNIDVPGLNCGGLHETGTGKLAVNFI